MKNWNTYIITFIFHLLLHLIFMNVMGQSQNKYTISGYIRDAETREELIGASILIKELSTGAITNEYGFFSLTLPAGNYTFFFSYVSYKSITKSIFLDKSINMEIELEVANRLLEEIVIESGSVDRNVESIEMSVIKMDIKNIRNIPALMGEVDILKAIQLFPGIHTVIGGSSDIYVRGGSADQNMKLLDEAPVYNASHLMGFFSLFNPDIIKDVKIYKGGIPAEYGGGLSSILDIRMKEGNSRRYSVSGGIGNISSRFTIEGPIIKDKSSFIISGRRSYADLFLRFSNNEELKNTVLYFYDLNTKVNYTINNKNRLFISGYFGRDVYKYNKEFELNWGNAIGTIRWNHLFSDKLFSNFTLSYINFRYFVEATKDFQGFEWNSNIKDLNFKTDFSLFIKPGNTIKFGMNSIYHKFNPGYVIPIDINDQSVFNEFRLPISNALEHAFYISSENKIGKRIFVRYGLRYSIFQNIGEGTVYNFDNNYELVDSTVYEKGKIFNTYAGFEPRFGFRYKINENSSLKASYNRTRQYLHLISSFTPLISLDIWMPSNPNLKPQIADQFALGFFKDFKENKYETSVEVYYKQMDNQVDYKDNAQILLNPLFESELRIGKAQAYGAEFLVRKFRGKFNGWISYTLSKVERKIAGINNGLPYPPKYDKTHGISIVLFYDASSRLSFSANWVYSTGAAVTLPTGYFEYKDMIAPVYTDRNGARLPDYHRLDISATLKNKQKPGKNNKGSWNFSIYNAYYRKNAFAIIFRQDADDPTKINAYKVYMFGIIPAVTYNFKF